MDFVLVWEPVDSCVESGWGAVHGEMVMFVCHAGFGCLENLQKIVGFGF
jgi:hypothetical protein